MVIDAKMSWISHKDTKYNHAINAINEKLVVKIDISH